MIDPHLSYDILPILHTSFIIMKRFDVYFKPASSVSVFFPGLFSKFTEMAKNIQHSKIVYPPGCKELSEDVGKDELIRRLKVCFPFFLNDRASLWSQYFLDKNSIDFWVLNPCNIVLIYYHIIYEHACQGIDIKCCFSCLCCSKSLV